MCFVHGSLDQATKACPMCKVFKPSGSRCPHVKDICRNRSAHPRYDVVYFKNAEVQTFNGCGYCKWVKVTSPPKLSGYQNAGWPGCCRAPSSNEHRYIQPADWPAVSIVHHIPIPSEIKSILDAIGVPPPRGNTSSPQSPQPSSPTASLGRSAGLQVAGSPPTVRRTSANVLIKPDAQSSKIPSVPILHPGRSGNSPPQTVSPLSRSSRTSLEATPPGATDCIDKSGDSPPSRKQADLEGSLAYRNSGRRPSLSSIALPSSTGKMNPDHQPDRERRRTLNAINTAASPSLQRSSPPGAGRSHGKPGNLESSMAGLTIPTSPSSASSSSGSSASSEHTVDGGFTDYLSDESEAELQRQAEIKAALVAQNRMEEQEFRAARQQLAHVDLRPPKSWNPDTHNTPRSQVGSQPTSNHSPAYVSTSAPFQSASYAHV